MSVHEGDPCTGPSLDSPDTGMSDHEEVPSTGLSNDSPGMDPPPSVTASQVEDDLTVEPGSKPLLGEGLSGQLPSQWLHGGASRAHTLGVYPRHYMSRHGLSPEESSELVAVTIAMTRKESEDHHILQNVSYFPRGLTSVSLDLLRQRADYLREKLDKIDMKRDGLTNLDLHDFYRPGAAEAAHL